MTGTLFKNNLRHHAIGVEAKTHRAWAVSQQMRYNILKIAIARDNAQAGFRLDAESRSRPIGEREMKVNLRRTSVFSTFVLDWLGALNDIQIPSRS